MKETDEVKNRLTLVLHHAHLNTLSPNCDMLRNAEMLVANVLVTGTKC
jgi:hypothetical protein